MIESDHLAGYASSSDALTPMVDHLVRVLRIKRLTELGFSLAQIAETKMKDLNANDIDAAAKIIEGSARAMGLEVVEG
mgnify:CR=1 FL=1